MLAPADSKYVFVGSRFNGRLKRRKRPKSSWHWPRRRRKRCDSLPPGYHRERRKLRMRQWREKHPDYYAPRQAREADLRARIRAGEAEPPKHGVPRGYNLGCRCELCREANTAACRKYQRKKARQLRVAMANNVKAQLTMLARREEGARLARELIGDALPDAGKRKLR